MYIYIYVYIYILYAALCTYSSQDSGEVKIGSFPDQFLPNECFIWLFVRFFSGNLSMHVQWWRDHVWWALLLHTCAVSLAHAWHTFVHTCTMTCSYVCDMTSLTRVPWLVHMRVTWLPLHVSHDSFICVWHDFLTRVPWLVHMCVAWLLYTCALIRSNVWHDLLRMCTMTHDVCVTWLLDVYVSWLLYRCARTLSYVCDTTLSHVCCDSFECVTWPPSHMCHDCVGCVWHDS